MYIYIMTEQKEMDFDFVRHSDTLQAKAYRAFRKTQCAEELLFI